MNISACENCSIQFLGLRQLFRLLISQTIVMGADSLANANAKHFEYVSHLIQTNNHTQS